MIFRHCWECMLEVTPSRRCLVDRRGSEVLLIPMDEVRLAAMCVAWRAR